jgi:CheY-like chemotaxis protein
MPHRVLLVDADSRFVAQLSELLEYQGHGVAIAAQTPAALQLCAKESFALVVTEIMPGGTSVLPFLEALRVCPGMEDAPVLVLSSGSATEGAISEPARRLGVLGFAPRESNPLDVGARVDELLADLPSRRHEVRSLRGLAEPVEPAVPPPTPPSSPTPPTEEDSFLPVDTGRNLPSDAVLNADGVVRFLVTLYQSHSSGTLRVESEGREAVVFCLNGYPVWVEADWVAQGLVARLEKDGALSRESASAVLERALSGAALHRLLLSERLVGRAELGAAAEALVSDALADTLRGEVTFRFEAGDQFVNAIPVHEVNPLHALWRGARQHLSPSSAESTLAELGSRHLGRTPTFNRLFGHLADTPVLRRLGEALAQPLTIPSLRDAAGGDRTTVDRALWLMLQAGLVYPADAPREDPVARISAPSLASAPRVVVGERGHPTAPASIEHDLLRRTSERIVSFEPTASRLSQERVAPVTAPLTAAEVEPTILRDHVTRLDLDHYAFLNVAWDAGRAEIEAAYARLAPRYRLRGLAEGVHPDTRARARELLGRLVLAVDDLTDPRRREDYDKRLAAGAAAITRSRLAAIAPPSTASLPAVSVPPDLPRTGAGQDLPDRVQREVRERWRHGREAMAQLDWKRAYAVLDGLRAIAPSEAGILADLGWSRWMAGPQDERTAEKSLEWIQLALTFDPDHRLAAEGEARILHAIGREDALRRALCRLLRVRPDHAWAIAENERLATAASADAARAPSALDRLLGRRR